MKKEVEAAENAVQTYESSLASIQETKYANEKKFQKHAHPYPFFTLLLNGIYSESYGRNKFVHKPMTFWWRKQHIPRNGAVGINGAHIFTVELKPLAIDLLKQYTPAIEDFSVQGVQLNNLSFRLYREFKEEKNCSSLVIEGLMMEILGLSSRKNMKEEKIPPKWLKLIVEQLNDDFLENPTTEKLALQANVHPIYLARVFRKFYKQTVGEYVQKLKVQYACKLLADKDLPIVEVALLTGFSDQSHLTRVFKRHMGLSPGVFRNSLV